MQILKSKDMPVFCEFLIQLLGCKLKLRFKKDKFPYMYNYLKLLEGRNKNIDTDIREFSEILLSKENKFGDNGIYTGMDFLRFINAKIM